MTVIRVHRLPHEPGMAVNGHTSRIHAPLLIRGKARGKHTAQERLHAREPVQRVTHAQRVENPFPSSAFRVQQFRVCVLIVHGFRKLLAYNL